MYLYNFLKNSFSTMYYNTRNKKKNCLTAQPTIVPFNFTFESNLNRRVKDLFK